MGKYPQMTVPADAQLEVTVGFFKGATGSDGVIFKVQFEEGQTTQTLLTCGASYDNKLDTMTQSLDSLAGSTGRFILYVNAGQSSGQDWAAWAEAKIEIAAPLELPDLIVSKIECGPGSKLSVTIKNIGSGALPGGWAAVAETYFDDEEEGFFDLTSPTSTSGGGIEEPGGSSTYLLAWDITAPVTVRVMADSTNDITESNEQNNSKEEEVEPLVTELPDLVIEEIACDQENSRIGYVIKNSGEAVAPAVHATVLFVNDEAICKDVVNIELAPGEIYKSWFDGYSWPQCQTIEVKVCADNSAVVEESNEQNNCLSQECTCAATPPPTQCPTGCHCLTKEEGYAKGLEFCLDDNSAPIICEVIDAEQGIYKYCFKTREEAPPPAKPIYPKRDIDGDDQVGGDDVAIIAAHYGGETGQSHVPWDVNDDGGVDYKDLAIVGANFGKSIIGEKLEDEGITTPQQLLDEVGSASGFQELGLRTDIDLERLLQAALQAELKDSIPGIDDTSIHLLEGLNIGSLAALQSLPADDPDLRDMLYHEIRLEWLASGGKERGEPLPTLDELAGWLTGARGKAPLLDVTEGAINFPDGSSLPTGDEPEDGDTPETLPDSLGFGVSTSREFATEVLSGDYPGMGKGVLAEGFTPDIPPPTVPEPCPRIEGYILGFPYDIETLKIQAERIESVMQFNFLTGEALGFRPTAVEGMMLDVQQAYTGPHGSPVTFYTTGCINPGKWQLTPIFYAEEPETVIWRGDWSPYHHEVEISSGLDSPTDVNFTFIPIETIRPTITITHTPPQPGGDDVVTFTVDVADDHMLQKIQAYEWGRYPDGTQTEPELVASYFWDSPSFPHEKTYRFERGPYPAGGPAEIHFEVAAWDYAGNPQSKTDAFRVTQFEVPPLALLGFTISPSIFNYYIGTIAEVMTSKDSDDGLGELHPSFNIEMIDTDGELYHEFRQDYPYYKHVEADASDGRPYCNPWVPVLAVRQSELDDCSGYSLHAHVYESDSEWERVIRAVAGFFEWLIDVIGSLISCITGDVGGCEDLVCNIFLPGNNVIGAILDPEDDYIGSAHFMTTTEASFGLSGDPAADFYTIVGTPDAEDSDWIGTTAEGIVEDYCHAGLDVILVQGESTVEDRGDDWIEVTYHPEVFMTKPIEKVKVKFVGAKVINDRDGIWRGSGDIYARTLVGTIGGEPADSNSHSLEGDDLSQLPYSAADTYEFDCGGVDSGDSFTKDKFIFDRSFSNPDLALLYIQIGLWDDDGYPMPDNEIGVLSIPWVAASIFDMIEHPDEAAARHGEGITVTIVHPVATYEGETVYVEGMPEDPTQDYYYVITDTREVWTRNYRKDDGSLWGHPGARITYEMWVKPAS
jgi:hypothetical protein